MKLNDLQLSLRIYIFFSFNTKLSSICYSSFLNTLTSTFFISFTTFTTLSFLAFDFLIFLIISSLAPSINNCLSSITLIFNHPFFNITWFSLSLSIPFAWFALLLKLSAYSILLLATYFKAKSNLDKYKAYLACLQFKFWAFMKYFKFLWSIQILN